MGTTGGNQNNNGIAIVPGLYNVSGEHRNYMLKHIWGAYNMLPDTLTNSLGKLYDVISDSYISPKNNKTLLDYTHDRATVYSTEIKRKYITVGSANKTESITPVTKERFRAWSFTDDDNLMDRSYQEYWGIAEPSKVFDVRKTRSEIERETRQEERNARKEARKERREERKAKRAAKKGKTYNPKTKGSATSVQRSFFEEYINQKVSNSPRIFKDYHYDEGDVYEKDEYLDCEFEEFQEYEELYNMEPEPSFVPETEYNVLPTDNSIRSRLVQKTAKLFTNGKIQSIIGRFNDSRDTEKHVIDSSKSSMGRSRGRNLLKRKPDGNNPYCRAWTWHHQYDSMDKLIRGKKNRGQINALDCIQTGRSKLNLETVLQYNGLVRITPNSTTGSTYKAYYDNIKKCMFSIENLAWKDDIRFGGRGKIMWFPPYDLKFSENSVVDWNENMFIGRGEPIYTYSNTRRNGTLSFTLLIDHPSILNNFKNEVKNSSAYEDEILRFFAGDIDENVFKCSEKDEKDKGENGKDGKVGETATTNPSDGQHTCFSIYFPFNYTGHSKSDSAVDSDWKEYLLEGFYTKSPEEWGEDSFPIKNGYESNGSLSATLALSKIESIEVQNDYIGEYTKNENGRYEWKSNSKKTIDLGKRILTIRGDFTYIEYDKEWKPVVTKKNETIDIPYVYFATDMYGKINKTFKYKSLYVYDHEIDNSTINLYYVYCEDGKVVEGSSFISPTDGLIMEKYSLLKYGIPNGKYKNGNEYDFNYYWGYRVDKKYQNKEITNNNNLCISNRLRNTDVTKNFNHFVGKNNDDGKERLSFKEAYNIIEGKK